MVLTHLVIFEFIDGASAGGVVPPQPPAEEPQQQGAGTRRRIRQRIILRLQGQEYELNSLQEVLQLIKAAKKDVPSAAREKAAQIVLSGKRIGDARKEETGVEVVSAPSSVREIIDDRIAEMERFYWARIAAQVEALEQDEEDVWLLM